jgi:hypothetical protein
VNLGPGAASPFGSAVFQTGKLTWQIATLFPVVGVHRHLYWFGMPCSFNVYIDEAGDEGFVFRQDGTGSSAWFILSAVVIRCINDHHLDKCLLSAKTAFKKVPNKPLHFIKLSHGHRKAISAMIAPLPCKLISVNAYKKYNVGRNPFDGDPHLFYRYLTRILLERVSWLCRDHRQATDGGDGSCKLIFSNRSCMSYDKICEYLALLRAQGDETKIDWTVIDPTRVTALPHDQKAGLQVADVVASGMYHAVTADQFNLSDPEYTELLLPAFYRHNNTLLWSYGVKWWPKDLDQLKAANPHLEKLAAWK